MWILPSFGNDEILLRFSKSRSPFHDFHSRFRNRSFGRPRAIAHSFESNRLWMVPSCDQVPCSELYLLYFSVNPTLLYSWNKSRLLRVGCPSLSLCCFNMTMVATRTRSLLPFRDEWVPIVPTGRKYNCCIQLSGSILKSI